MGEQEVVHLPERALVGGRLGRLRSELRVRVDVVQRQVAPDVAHVAEIAQELPHDRLCLPAERALEVAVLDERDRRVDRAADVVALGVDVDIEIDERLGRAEQRADTGAAGSSAVARKSSQVRIAAQSAALRIPSFASSSWPPSKASVATRSGTVKPIPAIVPPPATAAQPTGGRSRPRLSRVASQDATDDARPACRPRSRRGSRA